jgi:acetyl-CoA carboxylase biotin carboxyl carrier protein
MKKRTDPKGKTAATTAGRSAPAASTASGVDLTTVRQLALIAKELNLSEVEVDPSGRIRVRRRVARALGDARQVGAARPPIALAPTPPPAPVAAEVGAEPGTFITSPFVGTFYRAPSPEAQAFVEVGETVRKGQVVCIVEAMKLMNEIEAESDGKVEEILVKNGEHVEYGQHLIRVAKS